MLNGSFIYSGLGYTARKPKGPVLVTPRSEAVAAPTDKRGFVTPKFLGLVRLHRPAMVSGVGSAYPQGRRQGFGLVTTPHAHRRPSQATVALVTPEGAKTMTPTTLGCTTPTSTSTDLHQLFADAHNAAAMSRYYLRRGKLSRVSGLCCRPRKAADTVPINSKEHRNERNRKRHSPRKHRAERAYWSGAGAVRPVPVRGCHQGW